VATYPTLYPLGMSAPPLRSFAIMEDTCSGREGMASKEDVWLGVKETN